MPGPNVPQILCVGSEIGKKMTSLDESIAFNRVSYKERQIQQSCPFVRHAPPLDSDHATCEGVIHALRGTDMRHYKVDHWLNMNYVLFLKTWPDDYLQFFYILWGVQGYK